MTVIADDPTFPPALPLDPMPQQDAPPFWENVPSPEAWPQFWAEFAPWGIACAVLLTVAIWLLVIETRMRRRLRAERARDTVVTAAEPRPLDRRSSRVRAVEEAEKSIALVPVADETLIP